MGASRRHKDKSLSPTRLGDSAGEQAEGRGVLKEAPKGPEGEEEAQPTTEETRWAKQAKKAAVEPWFPSHVRACANNDLPSLPWFLSVWPRSKPAKQTRIVYTCGSYRCPSPLCQRKAAHTDFARIKAALDGAQAQGREASDWCFMVLTIDQLHTFGTGKEFRNEQEAFKSLSRNTQSFLQRLRRAMKRNGWRVLKNEWVATVEIQRNGWPHLNLVFYSPELAAELRAGNLTGEMASKKSKRSNVVSGWLAEAVTSTSWGAISTAEAARDQDALAGYIVKIGGEFDRSSGEIAKITQAPKNAVGKFRRIRAGKGFLPPQGRNVSRETEAEEYTGVMMKHENIYGQRVAGPMLQPDQIKPKGETKAEQDENARLYCEGVALAMKKEREDIAELERIEADRRRGGLAKLSAQAKAEQRWRKFRMIYGKSR